MQAGSLLSTEGQEAKTERGGAVIKEQCKKEELYVRLKEADGRASVTKYPLHLGGISIGLRAKGSKSI